MTVANSASPPISQSNDLSKQVESYSRLVEASRTFLMAVDAQALTILASQFTIVGLSATVSGLWLAHLTAAQTHSTPFTFFVVLAFCFFACFLCILFYAAAVCLESVDQLAFTAPVDIGRDKSRVKLDDFIEKVTTLSDDDAVQILLARLYYYEATMSVKVRLRRRAMNWLYGECGFFAVASCMAVYVLLPSGH